MQIERAVELAGKAIAEADALLIAAGAGMGVDSGLPDFRGREGFWRAYPAIAKLGLSFESIANPAWFDNDPQLAWAFYGHRLNLYRKTVPHQGFRQLLQMAAPKPAGYFVFTSNVDGQFQKAGFPPERIVECHGSIHSLQCTVPCGSQTWPADGEVLTIDEPSFRAQQPLPKCPACSALARPNILMFGDMGWVPGAREAQDKRYDAWLDELLKQSAKVAVVEIGAGSTIATVRYNSERVARNTQGTLVRINPRESNVPDGHIGLPLGAADGIQRIAMAVSDVHSH